MRVISGVKKGLRLITPEGESTRPTSDRAKEALFGSIQFEIAGAMFLDIFSGSGAVGIEAISRGAEKSVFIENDKNALRCLKDNLKNAGFGKNALVIDAEFSFALAKLSEAEMRFDFIFMDPPYASGYYEKALNLISEYGLLADNGTIICEHDGRAFDLPDGYKTVKNKKYGKNHFCFIKSEV